MAIIIGIKIAKKSDQNKPLAKVYHSELWGNRNTKNETLWSQKIVGETWIDVDRREPQWAFINRDAKVEQQFSTGFALNALFNNYGNGVVTKRDALCIQPTRESVWKSVEDFANQPEDKVKATYSIADDVRDWRYEWAKADVLNHFDPSYIQPINYRPFDQRYIFYTGNSRGFVGWPVKQVMTHYLGQPNIGLLIPKAHCDADFAHSFVTDKPSEAIFLSGTTGSNAMNFPLYLYPEKGTLETERRVNFDPKIYAEIRERAGLSLPLPSGEGGAAPAAGGEGDQPAEAPSPSHASRGPLPLPRGEEIPDELLIFDYIYGVLHSPDYRRTYAQFLKIDFPRIPYPASPEVFAHVAEKGGQLRRLHLMEDAAIGATPYPFKGEGDNVVVKPAFAQIPFASSPVEMPGGSAQPMGVSTMLDTNGEGNGSHKNGRVHINPDQYFDAVPLVAWEFHIGGYQPAQKWLKDRKGRGLSFEDVMHYQKIIKILIEPDRIMRELELPL